MTTARPDSIRIGPVVYRIEWKDGEWGRQAHAYGQIDNDGAFICLNADISPGQLADTFLHEAAHGIMWVRHGIQADESLTGEKACDIIGVEIPAFWIDNPDAFTWWRGLIGL